MGRRPLRRRRTRSPAASSSAQSRASHTRRGEGLGRGLGVVEMRVPGGWVGGRRRREAACAWHGARAVSEGLSPIGSTQPPPPGRPLAIHARPAPGHGHCLGNRWRRLRARCGPRPAGPGPCAGKQRPGRGAGRRRCGHLPVSAPTHTLAPPRHRLAGGRPARVRRPARGVRGARPPDGRLSGRRRLPGGRRLCLPGHTRP